MTEYIYEVWYDYFDGTQANLGGYQEKIATYVDKDKALARVEEENSKVKYEKPFYLKEVEIDD